jgi:tetratricopeptide (TPR) repeat protein
VGAVEHPATQVTGPSTDDPGVALRLIDNAGPLPGSSPAPLTDADLAHRARAALDAQDLAAYVALPALAADLTDPHRRYVARRTLVEVGLLPRPHLTGHQAAATFLATARVALDVLTPDPAEPVLLNYAGVAFYELGAHRPADALFRASRSLAPSEGQADHNLRQLKRARKAGVRVDLPPAVAREVASLERRAKELAGRARPAEPGTIALCMIVKDEEAVLERCLASAAGAVDEIIVVDTGSADATVEIAERFGARVLEHAWNDDFAEARNVGLEVATSDWILFLDADEWLDAGDAPKLRELTRRTWREGFRLPIHNRHGHDSEQKIAVHEAMRLFRNRPEHRFVGRVHEGAERSLPSDAPERIEAASVRIDHDGYLERTKVAKNKGDRNLSLLLRQLGEEGESGFLLFNLGTEYAAGNDLDTAARHFGRAWQLLCAQPEPTRQPYAPALAARYADTLRGLQRFDDSVRVADEALALFPDFTDLVYVKANVARSRGDAVLAEELLHRCLELGDAPARYVRSVGAGSYLAAIDLAGLLMARGQAATAEELIAQTLADHPQIQSAAAALTEIMIARGAAPDAIVDAVAARVGELTGEVRYTLAATFHDAGLPAAAEQHLRLLLDAEPGDAPAHVALVEALLSQSRFDEAAAVAAALPEDSPLAPTAAVSQAFAAIVGGDATATPAALERAERAGVAEHDRALLGAWATAAGLADAPAGTLSLRSLGRALTFLEAVLRVQAFDAFAALLPLVEGVDGLPARERRELLAAMYLRRGFLDSAAEEWAAACDEGGPDARALTGLAQVAAARGEAGDAQVFAEAAIELDPAAATAHRVLAAVSG